MRFSYNTTPEETIAYLRDQAISSNAGLLVVDAIDALADNLELPGEIEKLEEQVNELEKSRDDLREELEMLVAQTTLACEPR